MSDDEVSVFTDADATRLAGIIDDARRAGIHHGNYTLARWILDRWPVEVSTPIASPAPHDDGCGCNIVPQPAACSRVTPHQRHEWWPNSFRQECPGVTAPAGEVVSVPPPAHVCDYVEPDGATHGVCHLPGVHGGRERAAEPAPVPPPVDALLNLVDELHSAVRDDDSNAIDRARGNIVMAVRDMYAAGVADGRRQATDG